MVFCILLCAGQADIFLVFLLFAGSGRFFFICAVDVHIQCNVQNPRLVCQGEPEIWLGCTSWCFHTWFFLLNTMLLRKCRMVWIEATQGTLTTAHFFLLFDGRLRRFFIVLTVLISTSALPLPLVPFLYEKLFFREFIGQKIFLNAKKMNISEKFKQCCLYSKNDLWRKREDRGKKKNLCQKWDSNPRLVNQTATWTQRLRPLGHPDKLVFKDRFLCYYTKCSIIYIRIWSADIFIDDKRKMALYKQTFFHLFMC